MKHKKEIQQRPSKPILEKKIQTIPAKSKLGEAVVYSLKLWSGLTQYLNNGYLPIDNNGAENGIKPFVIGRKNWLFADTQRGAEVSAKWYFIIESSKANGHDVYHYLSYLFKQLPLAKTEHDVQALLAWNPKITDNVVV